MISGDTIITSDLVELLTPTHDRATCSDTNPTNGYQNSKGYVRCLRCLLLVHIGYRVKDLPVDLFVNQLLKPGADIWRNAG